MFVDDHIVRLWKEPAGGRTDEELLTVMFWGEAVRSVDRFEDDTTRVELPDGKVGWVRGPLRIREDGLLQLVFVDVGQGDACEITTPGGQRVLVDGGGNKQLARYLASKYWAQTSAGETVTFDALVVTHGDADHFAGLPILILDAVDDPRPRKSIRFAARRVYHNGLAKRSGAVAGDLGPLITCDDGRTGVLVVDDPRTVPREHLSRGFQRWAAALDAIAARAPLEVRRLDRSVEDAFAFLDDLQVEVLGPSSVRSSEGAIALPVLRSSGSATGSNAATINGHSVVLRLTLGNVSILLAADLTEDAERTLLAAQHAGRVRLRSHVLKVPHHGSDDVCLDFLHAVRPLVSIISAGDESAAQDYLHPRANVLGALGNAGLGVDPLIFITNLAAFDRYVGPAVRVEPGARPEQFRVSTDQWFYARERSTFGVVHVRTDGEELLALRRGARRDRHEAYAYRIDADGHATAVPIRRR